MSRPRVVVTGVGAVTPLGLTAEETWQGLLAGRSGVGPITQFDVSHLPVRIAGEVKGFDPARYLPAKEARRISRASQLAVAAAQEALAMAGLAPPLGERAGVCIGTGIGGLEWAFAQARVLWDQGWERVSPFAIPASLANMPAHHVSRWAQALGPILAVITACAAGTQAVGEGAEMIRRGAADIVLAGGWRASFTKLPSPGLWRCGPSPPGTTSPSGPAVPLTLTGMVWCWRRGRGSRPGATGARAPAGRANPGRGAGVGVLVGRVSRSPAGPGGVGGDPGNALGAGGCRTAA